LFRRYNPVSFDWGWCWHFHHSRQAPADADFLPCLPGIAELKRGTEENTSQSRLFAFNTDSGINPSGGSASGLPGAASLLRHYAYSHHLLWRQSFLHSGAAGRIFQKMENIIHFYN
jgi:hypothetical protein